MITDNKQSGNEIYNPDHPFFAGLLSAMCDTEKVTYALQGISQDVDRLIADYNFDPSDPKCTGVPCKAFRQSILSVLIDSRCKYNLTDAEFIKTACMILY
jgi:hypothetical protein